MWGYGSPHLGFKGLCLPLRPQAQGKIPSCSGFAGAPPCTRQVQGALVPAPKTPGTSFYTDKRKQNPPGRPRPPYFRISLHKKGAMYLKKGKVRCDEPQYIALPKECPLALTLLWHGHSIAVKNGDHKREIGNIKFFVENHLSHFHNRLYHQFGIKSIVKCKK